MGRNCTAISTGGVENRSPLREPLQDTEIWRRCRELSLQIARQGLVWNLGHALYEQGRTSTESSDPDDRLVEGRHSEHAGACSESTRDVRECIGARTMAEISQRDDPVKRKTESPFDDDISDRQSRIAHGYVLDEPEIPVPSTLAPRASGVSIFAAPLAFSLGKRGEIHESERIGL